MALSIQVGTLTSFFAPALRSDATRQGAPPPSERAIRQRVEVWRTWISDGLERGGHLPRPLAWNEADPEPPDVAELASEALRALKLWLAYDGCSESRPTELPRRAEYDPRWVELAENDFTDTAWDQLLIPELWLPEGGAFTFPCPYPDGHEVQAGWIGPLRQQLAALHEREFAATPFDARLAESTDPGTTRDLATLARNAAAVLSRMADRAATRHLPMLLHGA